MQSFQVSKLISKHIGNCRLRLLCITWKNIFWQDMLIYDFEFAEWCFQPEINGKYIILRNVNHIPFNKLADFSHYKIFNNFYDVCNIKCDIISFIHYCNLSLLKKFLTKNNINSFKNKLHFNVFELCDIKYAWYNDYFNLNCKSLIGNASSSIIEFNIKLFNFYINQMHCIIYENNDVFSENLFDEWMCYDYKSLWYVIKRNWFDVNIILDFFDLYVFKDNKVKKIFYEKCLNLQILH